MKKKKFWGKKTCLISLGTEKSPMGFDVAIGRGRSKRKRKRKKRRKEKKKKRKREEKKKRPKNKMEKKIWGKNSLPSFSRC
jgi:hypothetical protein